MSMTYRYFHGYFYEPVLIKNIWYCYVHVNKYHMYMENSMDLLWLGVFETIFLTRKWVSYESFHVPV